MPTPRSVRLATLADIPALFDIRTSVRENHLDLAQLLERGVTPASVADMLDDPRARVWAAEEAEAGIVAFSMADGRTGSVFALFVHPAAEGRGHGRALLAAAEAWLFSEWEAIWLTTGEEPHLRSHSFYRTAGWTPAGRADHGDVRYEKRRPGRTEGYSSVHADAVTTPPAE